MLKTVFFGTPSVAVPFLEQLNTLTQVVLVVTRADRPCGRGLELTPCPVKKRALELGLKVISPEKFKDSVDYIASLKADLGLAVAYGKIFRKPALEALKLGIMNVHFSLLPKYRGAAPLQHALFNGEKETGISAFWIDEGLDSGPLAAQKKVEITPQDNEITLFDNLTHAGLEAMQTIIKDLEAGKITKIPQSADVSFAPIIDKKDTFVNFSQMTAQQIHGKVRGLAGGMPAFAKALTPEGETIQLLKTDLKPHQTSANTLTGSIIAIERGRGFFVQCLQDVLFIERLRPAGKKEMSAWDFINGRKLCAGQVIFS